MKRSGAMFGCLVFLALAAPAQTVLHVGPGGHPTIAAALQVAPQTAVIRLAPGVHLGVWSIQHKSIRFVADGPGVIVDPLLCTCTLLPGDRLEFSGVRLVRTTPSVIGAFMVTGGTATFDDCSIAAMTIHFDGTALHLRQCVSTGSTLILRHGDTTASSSALAGAPAVSMRGGTLQLASGSLQGSAESPALTVQTTPLGLWIVDSQLIGGNSQFGAGLPAIAGPLSGSVRMHRSSLSSGTGPLGQSPPLPATATVVHGPLLGVESQPAGVAIGGSIQLRFRGEPLDALLAIAGFAIGDATTIPGVEQPAFGMTNAIVLGLLFADPTGVAVTGINVPADPALRNLAIVFRGVNVSRVPMELSPVVPVVVR